MWMTPLLAKRLALITVALPADDWIVTSSSLVIVIGSPPVVFILIRPHIIYGIVTLGQIRTHMYKWAAHGCCILMTDS